MQKSAITNSLLDSILRQFSLKVRAKQQPSTTADCLQTNAADIMKAHQMHKYDVLITFNFHVFSCTQVWMAKLAVWADYVSYKRHEPPLRGPVTASPFAAAPAAPPAAQYFSAFDNHCGSVCQLPVGSQFGAVTMKHVASRRNGYAVCSNPTPKCACPSSSDSCAPFLVCVSHVAHF